MNEDKKGRKEHPQRSVPTDEVFISQRLQATIDTILNHIKNPQGGVLLVTGAQGMGKTVLVSFLVDHLLGGNHPIANFKAPPELDHDFVPAILDKFHIQEGRGDYHGLFQALQQYAEGLLQQGKQTLIVIDRAEVLSSYQKEVIGYLSSLQSNGRGLFKILLVIREEGLDALKQDPAIGRHLLATVRLEPFDAMETEQYLLHRSKQRGFHRSSLDPDILEDILQATGGRPAAIDRLIEALAQRNGGPHRPDAPPTEPAGSHRPPPSPPPAGSNGNRRATDEPGFQVLPETGPEAELAREYGTPFWERDKAPTTGKRGKPKQYTLLLAGALLFAGGGWLLSNGNLKAWITPSEAHAQRPAEERHAVASHTEEGHELSTPATKQHTTASNLLETLEDSHSSGEDGEMLDLHRLIAKRGPVAADDDRSTGPAVTETHPTPPPSQAVLPHAETAGIPPRENDRAH